MTPEERAVAQALTQSALPTVGDDLDALLDAAPTSRTTDIALGERILDGGKELRVLYSIGNTLYRITAQNASGHPRIYHDAARSLAKILARETISDFTISNTIPRSEQKEQPYARPSSPDLRAFTYALKQELRERL